MDTEGEAMRPETHDHHKKGERLLTLPEVADYIGVPLQTLYAWRSRGDGPRGIRVGKHVRVRRDELERWLELHADPRPAA